MDKTLERTRCPTGQSHPPDPIDIHVGNRLREGRLRAHLKQTELGKGMHITFQAVQKFEAGKMRLAASRLYTAAKLLHRPISFFFEGIEPKAESKNAAEFGSKELELIAAFRSIKDQRLRENVRQLLRELAGWYAKSQPGEDTPPRV